MDSYDELFRKYQFLLSEVARLKEENAELKRRLGMAVTENGMESDAAAETTRWVIPSALP